MSKVWGRFGVSGPKRTQGLRSLRRGKESGFGRRKSPVTFLSFGAVGEQRTEGYRVSRKRRGLGRDTSNSVKKTTPRVSVSGQFYVSRYSV